MFKYLLALCLTSLLIFSGGPCRAEKVLVVMWEGTNYYRLQQHYQDAQLPNLQRLGVLGQLQASMSCYGGRCVNAHTSTQHASVLTGVDANIHGVWTDDTFKAIPPGLTIYEKLRAGVPGIKLALLAFGCPSFPREVHPNAQRSADIWETCQPWSSVKGNSDLAAGVARSVALLQDWETHGYADYFAVVAFDQPHAIGHQVGIGNAQYNNIMFRTLDKYLGQLVAAVSPETDVFVISDHGFGDIKIHGAQAAPKQHFRAPEGFVVQKGRTQPLSLYNEKIAAIWLNLFGINAAQ